MLTRMIDGQEVVISPAEETAIRAEWAAEDARRAAEVPPTKVDAPLTVNELAAQMIADGTMTQAKIDAIKAAR